jgi:hypothetical protein
MKRGELLIIVAVVWGMLTFWAIKSAEDRGARLARVEQLTAQIETLEVRTQKLDTIWRDSVRYATQWQTRWDTVRVQDTVTIDSVVYVPLAPAESTINSCYAALRSCARASLAKDTLIRAQANQITALQDMRPSLAKQLTRDALWLLTGFAVGTVIRR